MTTHRPNVAMYQEYATLSFTPATPTLHTLVVGPCYQILDYLDDKDDCYADVYGELEADCPFVTSPEVIIADPPSVTPGAVLVDDSVKVYFDEGRAIVVADSGANHGVYTNGDNLFGTNVVTHFGVAKVAAGDCLIVQPTAGSDDLTLTIKELAYTLSQAGLTLITDGVIAGDTLTIYNDTTAITRNGVYTVKRVLSETALEVEDSALLVGNAGTNTGMKIVSAGGVVRHDTAGTPIALIDTCNLRVTEDFGGASPGACLWRVEREFHNYELLSTDYSVDSTTKVITVDADITVDLGTAAPLLNNDVTYAKIYVEYRALRRDLQEINEVSQDTAAMELLLGKLDARNPLHVGAYIAALNTLTTVKVYGLVSDDLTGYMDFVSSISSERNIYAIVPLTYNTSVLGFLNTMAITLADPTYVLANGIRQKFRAILGAIDLPTVETIVGPLGSVTTTQVTSTAPLTAGRRTFTFVKGTGGTAPLFTTTQGVIPGDIVTITQGATVYTYTVAHVKSAGSIEVDSAGPELEVAYVIGAGSKFKITDPTGLVNRFAEVAYSVGVLEYTITPIATLDDLFLIATVPAAHFVTDGVLPGDIFQMPSNPMVNSFTIASSWVVDDVLSETRLQIMNLGTDTPTTENELPHQGYRAGGSVVTQGSMYAQVVRYYTKAQQVTEMLATAHSFSSKRLVLCYPYQVKVADLKDGSLDRLGATDPIDALPDQPGYYLACAVGGQTAGQPSQQGFTFLGINGINQVIGSNDYFSEEQLTELSNGGIYVFTQESLASLPSTIHEVTTDVSTVEFSEYMVLKNFDFVAWTFLDVLLDFIGKWNVTEETIQFIAQAELACISTLKSDRKPRIGAPLIDASIVSNAISDLSSDRVESYVDVQLPMTLNIIGCHLVA